MSAATYDLTIEQGADFSVGFVFNDGSGSPLNIAGATFKAQIRQTASSNQILGDFTCAIDSLTTGRMVLSLTAAQTGNLTFTAALYDVFMTLAGVTSKMLVGNATLIPAISR